MQFLPSQHPADAPRVEYFSGERCGGGQDEPGPAADACWGPYSEPCLESAKSQSPHSLPGPAAAPASLSLPCFQHKPCSIATIKVRDKVTSKQSIEGADASLTEAHTPVLGLTSNVAKIATFLTIAASTQSPRNHSPVPELCKHDTAEANYSPYGVAGAAGLAPPVLMPSHGAVHASLAAAAAPVVDIAAEPSHVSHCAAEHDPSSDKESGEQHSCCMSEGMQPHTVASGALGGSRGQAHDIAAGPSTAALYAAVAPGSQGGAAGVDQSNASIAKADAAAKAAAETAIDAGKLAGPTSAVTGNHSDGVGPVVEEASSDDDDLLFSVNLTNLSAASAANSSNVPQSGAFPVSMAGQSKLAQNEGYSAAAEAVERQSRLWHAYEEHTVKGLAAWGQHEHGLTLVQQRKVDRHIVQRVST